MPAARSSSLGEEGSDDGQFSGLTGIAVGSNGHVYAADYDNARVEVFDADGTYAASWDGRDSEDGPLASADDVAVAPDGSVYVSDDARHRIVKFTPKRRNRGSYRKVWTRTRPIHLSLWPGDRSGRDPVCH